MAKNIEITGTPSDESLKKDEQQNETNQELQKEQNREEEQTENEEEEEEEEHPSSAKGKADTTPSSAKPKKTKKSTHLPKEKEILKETKSIAKKYTKDKVREIYVEKDLDKKKEETAEDEKKVNSNKKTIGQLREAAEKMEGAHKTRREKLADQLDEATSTARTNISNAKRAIVERELCTQINGVYAEADDLKEDIKHHPEKYKEVAGYADLVQAVKKLKAQRDALPSLRSLPKAKDKKVLLDNTIKELNAEKNKVATAMNPDKKKKADKLVERRENAGKFTKALNQKYKESTPIVRLIRKARSLKDVAGEAQEEKKGALGAAEFIDEHITGTATDIIDASLEYTYGEKSEKSSLVGAIKVALSALFGKKSISEAEKDVPQAMFALNMFAPLLKAFVLCMHVKQFMKAKERSNNETIEGIEGLGQETLDTLISGAETAIDFFNTIGVMDEIPILGPVLGLISNAVGAVIKIRGWFRAAKRRDDAAARKTELKKKMEEKRAKYAGMGIKDADGKELLGFVGKKTVKTGFLWRDTGSKTHIDKKKDGQLTGGNVTTIEDQQKNLEQSLTGKDIHASLADMKKHKMEGDLSEDDQKLYYQMKTMRMIQEYRELKETKYVNEKRIRSGQIELIHTALDVAKNILGLIPNITAVAGLVLGVVNAASKWAHTGFTFVKQKGRDKGWWGDGSKTTAAKAEKRGGMALDIFNQMIFVSGYMREASEAKTQGTFAELDPVTSSTVGKRMEYLDAISNDLSYKFSSLHLSKNKNDLLDKMASAFSREG